MTTNANAAETKKAGKGYNLELEILSREANGETANGLLKIRTRVRGKMNGQMRERSMTAMGKAAEELDSKLVVGETVRVRCLFSQVENEDGSKGGQYLTALGLPREIAANDTGEAGAESDKAA